MSAAATLDVYRFGLAVAPGALAACRELLEPAERARAGAMAAPRAREFVVARACLRALVGAATGVPARSVRLALGAHGKPEIREPAAPGLRVSVSHSHGLGLVALLRGDPEAALGVDVERIRARVDCLRVARRFFSEPECRRLAALGPEARRRAFFRGWCCKEAVIKADGGGVGLGLGRFDVELDPDRPPRVLATRWPHGGAERWTLLDLALGAGYAGAAAIRAGAPGPGPAPELRCFDLDASAPLPPRAVATSVHRRAPAP